MNRIVSLLGLILRYRGALAGLIGISVLVQLISTALPLLTGVLIDRVVPQKDYGLLALLAAGYCALQSFNTLSGYIRERLAIHLRTRLEADFVLRFFNHLVDLPYQFFQKRTPGDLLMRLGSNTAVREILTSALLSTCLDGLMATIYLLLLLMFNVPLTALVALLAAVRIMVLVIMRRKQKRLLAESLDNQARSQTAQVEILVGIETLKAMGLERGAADRWSDIFSHGLEISVRRGRLDAAFNVILSLLGMLSALLLTFYGGYLVLKGVWTLGSMVAFSALAGGFLGPLNKLLGSALQLQLLEVYLQRLSDVWETPREQARIGLTLAEPLTGLVELERVSFSYQPESPFAIREVSIAIPAGAHVAIVGRTGCGKSTLARLLATLYCPGAGRVLVDGKDVRSLDLQWVRGQFGMVTQDPQLFSGSIRYNIALADPDMSFESVVSAAKLACVHDDIAAMPLKYDAPLSDRGFSVSGGQRQRLALARALAAKPKVLILDEATSHLDLVTEERVNANLASLRCTRIVITHRLSTIRNADLIIVLADGRVAEAGRHEELLAWAGEYAALMATTRESDRSTQRPELPQFVFRAGV